MSGDVPARRDRLRLSLYGTFVTWGWFLYAFSPIVPVLGDELGVSDAQAGLHGTAMAVGCLVAAFLAPPLAARTSRRTVLLTGLLAVAGGTALLLLGATLAMTLLGVVVLSTGGNLAVWATQVALTRHQPAAAAAAITEGNGVGSGVGLLAPLVVGAAVALGWGWRAGVLVTAVLALATAVVIARLPATGPLGPSEAARTSGAVRGDRISVGFLIALIAAIAVENATTFWAVELVMDRTGAPASIAAAATAGLVGAMTAARFITGPLSLRLSPSGLLAGSFLLAIVGWAVLWLATSPGVALVGLVVAGFGYGAQYPVAVALLLASTRATERAQSWAMLAGAAAIGLAPPLLGALADAFGVHNAFLLVPVLALAGAGATLAGRRRVAVPVTV